MAMRKERGEIDNHFIAEMNGPDRPWRFYGLALALTAGGGPWCCSSTRSSG